MADDGEFSVALSFAQMAAILTQESLSPAEIMSNRIFGSLRLVGGIVELAGSGVLCAVPDPTMISKVGCIAMGVHASDQLSAGATQLFTGKETDSFSFKAGESVAEALGASKATGQVIGLATEFAVPLSTASLYNAFRVSSVRAGRISVVTSEKPLQASKSLGGGHAMRKHVGKDINFLTSRFASKKVGISSTFYDLQIAERAVSQALQRNRLKNTYVFKS
ncbi:MULTISPECIES: RNase A-like domain-containing protein [Pseudomonas]|uniref:RNase A-like domain-containing protein n=1 Tax=Pseudomonas TaxID=286 RepID=UPI00227711D5|nr:MULTISPECIES: RNase A-like domain-containing protein [Pseudomonas]